MARDETATRKHPQPKWRKQLHRRQRPHRPRRRQRRRRLRLPSQTATAQGAGSRKSGSGQGSGNGERSRQPVRRQGQPGHRRRRRRAVRWWRSAADPERAGNRQSRQPPRSRSRAASRRKHRPHDRHGLDRRSRSRSGRSPTPVRPIMVPVGEETLGRIMNVIGEPVDEAGPIKRPISAPSTSRLRNMSSSRRKPRSSSPASRSSICSLLMPRAARSACSAVPASARPFSSWN